MKGGWRGRRKEERRKGGGGGDEGVKGEGRWWDKGMDGMRGEKETKVLIKYMLYYSDCFPFPFFCSPTPSISFPSQ